jgi:hypothetical protein
MFAWMVATAPVWLPLVAFIAINTHDTWQGGEY